MNNFNGRSIFGICSLRNTDSFNNIAFCCKKIQSFFKLVPRYPEFSFYASTYVNSALLCDLIFQDLCRFLSFLKIDLSSLVKPRTYSRLANAHLTADLARAKTVITKRFSTIDIQTLALIVSLSICSAKIGGSLETQRSSYFGFRQTRFAKFLKTRYKIALMLIWILT